MSVIVFEETTKQYPRAARPAVEDVSLEVPQGEVVVILGSSGSGKTTLLKMVNRLLEPTHGRILLGGQDIQGFSPEELRRRIGYVIQQIGLFPHWTVARNVATVPAILGWPTPRIRARVDELLELVGLPPGEYRNRYPAQLSGGQQQRVGIVRALAADPEIMLMDEPFGAVDAITRARLQTEFLALQKRTCKTILFVTHDVEEALRLANRLIIMDQGHVLQYDTPLNVVTRPAHPFVRELLGADDMMRLLGLISVRSLLEDLDPARTYHDVSPLSLDDSVSHALGRLLRSDHDTLPVADEQGHLAGQCSLSKVRARLRLSAPDKSS